MVLETNFLYITCNTCTGLKYHTLEASFCLVLNPFCYTLVKGKVVFLLLLKSHSYTYRAYETTSSLEHPILSCHRVYKTILWVASASQTRSHRNELPRGFEPSTSCSEAMTTRPGRRFVRTIYVCIVRCFDDRVIYSHSGLLSLTDVIKCHYILIYCVHSNLW